MNRHQRGFALFEWINRRVWPLAGGLVVVAVGLALLAPVVGDDGEPEFGPGGEIYDVNDRVEEVFSSSSPIRAATFVVEAPGGGDVLTWEALTALKRSQDAIKADPDLAAHLATEFDPDLGLEVDGIFSIADAVDAALPAGLQGASDAEVKGALGELLADGSQTAGLRFLLSQTATSRTPTTVEGRDFVLWEAPAFLALVRYDNGTFPASEQLTSFDTDTNLEAERWLRDLQAELRGNPYEVTAIGVAIDPGLVGEEQSAVAGPFIFLAVAFIVILVGALLRSYWAAMLVAAGLGVVMMSYNGINALIGLKVGSPLLIMVVPIALISFGVDFFIHGSGRAREFQVAGVPRERAYPLGQTAVFTALLLAALSSAAAFLSNAVSGIQAVIEFGIAASVALILSYLILGLVVPKLLLSIEEHLGPRPADPSHATIVLQKLGFVLAALIAGIAVTTTIVLVQVGWVLFLAFVAVLIVVPFYLARRRNRRAARDGRPLTDEVRGAGHGFVFAGSLVHFLARWRVITVPIVTAFAAIGLWGAFQVEQGFELKDFFSSDTDFARSLDTFGEFFGEGGGGEDFIYLEGDLTHPATLAATRDAAADLNAAGGDVFRRDFNGDLELAPNAVAVAELAVASPPFQAQVADALGVRVTDADGDGLPDTAEQVAAVYAYATAAPVVNAEGLVVFTPGQTESFLHVDGVTQATRIGVGIASLTDDAVILEARDELERVAADLESALAGRGVATVAVSGSVIEFQDTLDSFTSAMLVSLPVAVVLTSLIVLVALVQVFRKFGRRPVSIAKRSVRYALVSMAPILLVVAWIYGFMWMMDYKINVITATIAAIAIGVGIDYATHFTVRFIEEFEGEPSRFPALRRAGEGTGGALAVSAATSMTGFLVMAFAPMPMFQVFGVLTAVMILFALSVSLVVLPSLLLLITPSRKGEERARLEAELTGGEVTYDPHARATAGLSTRNQ